MVRTKKRGTGSGDFSKSKQRVGKKKQLRANETRTEVHFRRIHVPNQSLNSNSQHSDTIAQQTSSEARTHRLQTLQDLLTKSRHYSGNERRNAVMGMRELLKLGGQQVEIATMLKGVCSLLIDEDRGVRTALLPLCRLLIVNPAEIAPFIDVFCGYVVAALTHPMPALRFDGLGFLEAAIEHIPAYIARHKDRTIRALTAMIESRRETDALEIGARSVRGCSTKQRVQLLRCLCRYLQITARKTNSKEDESEESDSPRSSDIDLAALYTPSLESEMFASASSSSDAAASAKSNADRVRLQKMLIECFVEFSDSGSSQTQDVVDVLQALSFLMEDGPLVDSSTIESIRSHVIVRFPVISRTFSPISCLINLSLCDIATRIARDNDAESAAIIADCSRYLVQLLTSADAASFDLGMAVTISCSVLPLLSETDAIQLLGAFASCFRELHERSQARATVLVVLQHALQIESLLSSGEARDIIKTWIGTLPQYALELAGSNPATTKRILQLLRIVQDHPSFSISLSHGSDFFVPLFDADLVPVLPLSLHSLFASLLYFANEVPPSIMKALVLLCRNSSLSTSTREQFIEALTARDDIPASSLLSFCLSCVLQQSDEDDDTIFGAIDSALGRIRSEFDCVDILAPALRRQIGQNLAASEVDETHEPAIGNLRRLLHLYRCCIHRSPEATALHDWLPKRIWTFWCLAHSRTSCNDEIVHLLRSSLALPNLVLEQVLHCINDEDSVQAMLQLLSRMELRQAFSQCRQTALLVYNKAAEIMEQSSCSTIETIRSEFVLIFGTEILACLSKNPSIML